MLERDLLLDDPEKVARQQLRHQNGGVLDKKQNEKTGKYSLESSVTPNSRSEVQKRKIAFGLHGKNR